MSGARPPNKDEHRYLVNVTEAVAIGAGVPMPKVYVIDNPAPNAFATGRDPRHGAIAVTTGLMSILDRQELEGVIAHEMAHVKNYDIRFASMLAATVGAIVLLRDVILRGMRFGGRSRRSSSSGGGTGQAVAMVLLIVLLILAPILATMVRLAVSRRREYLADATGAYITRNPDGLASALAKLRDYRGTPIEGERGRAAHVLHQPGGEARTRSSGWRRTRRSTIGSRACGGCERRAAALVDRWRLTEAVRGMTKKEAGDPVGPPASRQAGWRGTAARSGARRPRRRARRRPPSRRLRRRPWLDASSGAAGVSAVSSAGRCGRLPLRKAAVSSAAASAASMAFSGSTGSSSALTGSGFAAGAARRRALHVAGASVAGASVALASAVAGSAASLAGAPSASA